MANNYLQFSEGITGLTHQEVTWIDHVCQCIVAISSEDYSTEGHHFNADGMPQTLIGIKAKDILAAHEGGSVQWEARFPKNDQVDSGEVWFYSEEAEEPMVVAEVVHHFFLEFRKKAKPPPVFTLTWATFCDKLRIGEFGGGALIVTREGIEVFGVHDWVDAQVDALRKKRKRA